MAGTRRHHRRSWVLVMTVLASLGSGRPAAAQLGALVSPGRLSRAHASLEGISQCLTCHEKGRQVTASKCLACHAPVAQRTAQKKGIHRNVTECISCHVEHAGVDAELRPFDRARFNHRADTAFPLDGLHATLDCAACHRTRSFLSVTSSCASCHADVHKGALGPQCATCHTTSVRFAETRTKFDHSRTAFPLTGAHAGVACTSCHRNNTFTGVKFESCASCHTDPHRQAFGTACASCHVTTQSWRTTRIDHSRTSFPLRGGHATVACVRCHVKPAMEVKPRADTCAACHADPHRGVFKQDCKACHTESTFHKGTFDHSTTRFPLADKHAGLACAACHKDTNGGARPPAARRTATARAGAPRATTIRTADFSGLRTDCASCHADVHRGELGAACETCHTARTFDVKTFTHARQSAFFGGQHATVTCVACHTTTLAPMPPSLSARPARVGFTKTSETCVSCHRDPHLGQVGAACETCHAISEPQFAVSGFSHDRTTFPLTGKHASVMCVTCHTTETADFPGGHGTAERLTGIGTTCVSCHEDPHRGELKVGCDRCHTSATFAVTRYTHLNARMLRSFFAGRHQTASCAACHGGEAAAGSASRRVAMTTTRRPATATFRISTTCTECHTDVHRGQLGPDCEACHRP